MANSAWIKVHRKITDNWIWKDSAKAWAWMDLLLMVNHEDKEIPIDGHMVTIKAGQKHTSIYKLAKRWGWSKNRVLSFFRLLEEAKMCTTSRTTNGTTITIVNWAFYQGDGYTEGTTNGTTNGTASGTAYGTTNGTQTRNKEIKNVKNNKAAAKSIEKENKKGVQRKVDLDAWLREQTKQGLENEP